MELTKEEPDGPLTLTGRVLAARQILTFFSINPEQEPSVLEPFEVNEPSRGDLKLSSTLDAKGRLAFQNERSASLVSGVLCASVYDGVCWRRFDLRSITPRAAYPNPALLESIVASIRAAAELSAGQECGFTSADNEEQNPGEPVVIVVCLGRRT